MPTDASTDPKRQVAEMAELVGGLAHELRNPLSTLMVNLKLLAEDLRDDRAHPDDTRRRALHRVDGLQREAARLQGLFDAFLGVVNPRGPIRTATELNGFIARLVEFFRPTSDGHGVKIELDLTEGPLHAAVDGDALRQALLNLLINAQQAMPNGGVLRIGTARRGGRAVISVADTGVGIAPEVRDRILRPFFSTKAGGHGLGLAFVGRMVREHGGTLRFDSAVGAGTTFTMELPTEPSPLAEADGSPASP